MSCLNCGASIHDGGLCEKCRQENHQHTYSETIRALEEMVNNFLATDSESRLIDAMMRL